MYRSLSDIHHEILKQLESFSATYAYPVTSEQLGLELDITPSYIREKVKVLQILGLVGVKRGRSGGYYLKESYKLYKYPYLIAR